MSTFKFKKIMLQVPLPTVPIIASIFLCHVVARWVVRFQMVQISVNPFTTPYKDEPNNSWLFLIPSDLFPYCIYSQKFVGWLENNNSLRNHVSNGMSGSVGQTAAAL